MRKLYNHGLTTEELFVNTPKHIIDKKKIWFKQYQGVSHSLSQAISEIFSFTLASVFHKMLDEKMRFKIPYSSGAYIDFTSIVDKKDFKRAVQGGRFKDIDFIESDFTGYNIKYFFWAGKQPKEYAVYLGGELKRKFISKINSGEKFYTIKDFGWKDVIEKTYNAFPHLTKEEIDKIVKFGFSRMHFSMKSGCALSFMYKKLTNLIVHVGVAYFDHKKEIEYYVKRRNRKLRVIESWRKREYDGYYYLAINAEQLADWYEANKNSRTLVKFGMVNLHRIQEETYIVFKHAFIFKVKRKKYRGWSFWLKKLQTSDIEYIGQAYNHKFTPSYMTWKDLIKEYGEQ